MKKRYLSGFFLQTIDKLLIRLAFLDKLALSPANLDMNFWASFSLITDQITHS